MRDELCVEFLQWALPQLHMRWAGFRKVRAQVCKRIDRRVRALDLAGPEGYRAYLEAHPQEWAQLDPLCRVTISRFYRDRQVFAMLAHDVLPALASAVRERGESVLRIWSAGCASGEEPYTLALLWAMELETDFPELAVEIVATDTDADLLSRARAAVYGSGSIKALPAGWRREAFAPIGTDYRLKAEYMRNVEFLRQDIREAAPGGVFDLVLCRNLAFTYFDRAVQLDVLGRIVASLRDGGALVLGSHETLPEGAQGLSAWFAEQRIYCKASAWHRAPGK